MKVSYKNDLKQTYFIIKDEESREDYQSVMLRENDIPGILKTEVRHVDGESHYYYNISGKTSFGTLHEKIKLDCRVMQRLVQAILDVTQELKGYMLDGNCLLLEPEYIFCDQDNFYFCYYPAKRRDTKQDFHKLTEFFVREVDYRDEEGIHLAYTLHKATMEENYSVEEIMKNMINKPEEEIPPVVDYTEQMEAVETEYSRIEEKRTILAGLPQKLFRRRQLTER